MYLGHLAVGLAAKRVMPRLSFAMLIAAPVAQDLGAALLGALGIERDLTHTLAAACVWTVVLGALSGATLGPSAGLLVAALVASHLPLDLVTSNLSLWSGAPAVGLGLYARPALDFTLEVGMLVAAGLAYRQTLPTPRKLWPLLAMLAVVVVFQGIWNFGLAS